MNGGGWRGGGRGPGGLPVTHGIWGPGSSGFAGDIQTTGAPGGFWSFHSGQLHHGWTLRSPELPVTLRESKEQPDVEEAGSP